MFGRQLPRRCVFVRVATYKQLIWNSMLLWCIRTRDIAGHQCLHHSPLTSHHSILPLFALSNVMWQVAKMRSVLWSK